MKEPKNAIRKIPKTRVKRAPGRKTSLRSQQLAAKKAAFLVVLESTCGNIPQAIALYNANGGKLSHGAPYEWARQDPVFSAKMADCNHLVAARLGKLAVDSIERGMKNGNVAATKLALDYYVKPEQASAANGGTQLQVNVSLAEALRTAVPVDAKVIENTKSLDDISTENASNNAETPISAILGRAEE